MRVLREIAPRKFRVKWVRAEDRRRQNLPLVEVVPVWCPRHTRENSGTDVLLGAVQAIAARVSKYRF